MNFLEKALRVGVSPENILSWLYLKVMSACGVLSGSLALRLKARLLGVSLGKNVTAHGPVGLLRWPGGEIVIGDNVRFISSWKRATASSLAFPARLRVFGPGSAIEIGQNCELNGTSITARSTRISLGKQVLVGPNCIIMDSDFHAPWPARDRASSPGYERDAPVSIGDFVWIGLNCIILKGVHIGKNSIIGAGSVVSRDVPENSIACGNPCRVIHMNTDENVQLAKNG